jgi:hypothetical protein
MPQLEWDKVQDQVAGKGLEALTHWVTRDRERLAQNTDLLAGGLAGVQGGLSGLLLRAKDIYTFGVPGTVKVTPDDGTTFGLSLPYRVVAAATVLEARADLFQGSGTVIALRLDGAEVLRVIAGAPAVTTPVALGKDQSLSAWVLETPDGAKGLMVQVRAG